MAWPLFEFAYVSVLEERLEGLAALAELEHWGEPDASGHRFPILHSYLQNTFARAQAQSKISYTSSGEAAAFNTGLVTPNQEFIYTYFTPNERPEGGKQWYLKVFLKESDRTLADFDQLPAMPTYFDDPADLIYDMRRELRVNFDHIIDENRDRLPEPYRSSTDNYPARIALQGAIEHAKKRVARNYKTAVPQFYQGRLQLLLPVSMTSPNRTDIALAIERHGDVYRAATCLTLQMAYSNARLIAKPDQDWLSVSDPTPTGALAPC